MYSEQVSVAGGMLSTGTNYIQKWKMVTSNTNVDNPQMNNRELIVLIM